MQNVRINTIGKYIYKHIDNAQSFKIGVNTCSVIFTILYELPIYVGVSRKQIPNDIEEMDIEINITYYPDEPYKVRINLIQLTPLEKTIGHTVIDTLTYKDLPAIYDKIMKWISKRINKEFDDFDFIY